MSSVCIYCQEEKADDSFGRVEHVLPQSFGKFESNLTLRGVVCDECNQFFGDNLEIALARDTFEGEFRFVHGVKDPENFRPFGCKSRMIIKVAEGDFQGSYAYREYSPEAGEIIVRPVPQAGFRRRDSTGYEYFFLDELPERSALEGMGIDLDHPEGIRAVAVEEAFLKTKLAEKGITFRRGGELLLPKESGTLLCEVEGTIDQTIFRAIAKIAFNYLAYWQGRDFVNESSFDPIRQFIRFSERPLYLPVAVTEQPVLADEPIVGKRRLGHLVTVNWAQDGKSIVSQVSLLNWMTYRICLAKDYSGDRRNIKMGHFFNVSSGEILELG